MTRLPGQGIQKPNEDTVGAVWGLMRTTTEIEAKIRNLSELVASINVRVGEQRNDITNLQTTVINPQTINSLSRRLDAQSNRIQQLWEMIDQTVKSARSLSNLDDRVNELESTVDGMLGEGDDTIVGWHAKFDNLKADISSACSRIFALEQERDENPPKRRDATEIELGPIKAPENPEPDSHRELILAQDRKIQELREMIRKLETEKAEVEEFIKSPSLNAFNTETIRLRHENEIADLKSDLALTRVDLGKEMAINAGLISARDALLETESTTLKFGMWLTDPIYARRTVEALARRMNATTGQVSGVYMLRCTVDEIDDLWSKEHPEGIAKLAKLRINPDVVQNPIASTNNDV